MRHAQLLHGDSFERLMELEPSSIDAIICDPPYELTALSRKGSPRKNDPKTPFGRTRLGETSNGGFMGKTWDATGIAFDPAFWKRCYRVLKPQGVLKAFSSTRTYHRVMLALEEAKFVDFKLAAWVYGSGFPKSHNVLETGIIPKILLQLGHKKKEKVNWVQDFSVPAQMQKEVELFGKKFMVDIIGYRNYRLPWELEKFRGYGTALKPAWEAIITCKKR